MIIAKHFIVSGSDMVNSASKTCKLSKATIIKRYWVWVAFYMKMLIKKVNVQKMANTCD